MNKTFTTIKKFFIKNFNPNNRLGFLFLLILFYWFKSLIAYFIDFRGLGINNIWQLLTAVANPIFFTAIFILLFGFIKRARYFYPAVIIFYIAINVLLIVNVIYYREMSSYVSFNTITGYGKVSQGLASASLSFLQFHDVFYVLDFILAIVFFRKFEPDLRPIKKPKLIFLISTAILGFFTNFTIAEIDRPQLVTRGFDDSYIVKYLGINFYTVQDAISSVQRDNLRANAKPSDIDKIRSYVKKNFASANPTYFGKAEGKNVIYLHLESFQQFSIDLNVNNQPVTPFLNSLYHNDDSISFTNFFHQVGQGKTTDAETMLETSTYGLPTGSVFVRYYANQFQSMPAILNQDYGYSTAVFHGNNASFWNRSVMYKSLGYQNFFDASYFDVSGRKAMSWGLKDKLFFKDSVQYLEKLPQPFYTKFLTVTNHTPYAIDSEDKDPNFTVPDTGSEIVDGYLETNHYLDQSIKEFYSYLDKIGILDNTVVILYGDHYGISDSELKYVAPLLGKDPDSLTDLDILNMQRVPFIINMPGSGLGKMDDAYGGEIDVMPTLEHLLGINTKKYVQFGQDLLSKNHKQLVVFRNGDWITPEFASISENIYDVKTGLIIERKSLSQELQNKLDKLDKQAEDRLKMSDQLIYKDLLRFYTPSGFAPIKPQNYDYSKNVALNILNNNTANSIFALNNNQTTTGLYTTDAPEQNDAPTTTGRILIETDDEDSSSSSSK